MCLLFRIFSYFYFHFCKFLECNILVYANVFPAFVIQVSAYNGNGCLLVSAEVLATCYEVASKTKIVKNP